MSIFISIMIFIAILTMLIFIHELGHYITAKLAKVKVEEFGLGLPPRIWGFDKWGTKWSLNWIPLGGFCKMAGEEDPEVRDSLAGKSVKARLFVLSAGSVAMLLFPLWLLPLSYMLPLERPAEDAGIRIIEVADDSPAYYAGLLSDDIILSVDGQSVYTLRDMHNAIGPKQGEDISLFVLRSESQFEITLVPRTADETPAGEGALGIQMSRIFEKKDYPIWEAVPKGFAEYGSIFAGMKDAFGALFTGAVPARDAIAGPIGIAHLTSEVSAGGAAALFTFAALISIILGIMNLLPLPALDGGRILFVAIEGIRRGKRISPQKEGFVHMIGFALLMVLFVFVSYNDIARIISGEGFFR